MTYKIERWIAYAHRTAFVVAVMDSLSAVIVAIFTLVVPVAQAERAWFVLILVANAIPMWLMVYLLEQARVRDW